MLLISQNNNFKFINYSQQFRSGSDTSFGSQSSKLDIMSSFKSILRFKILIHDIIQILPILRAKEILHKIMVYYAYLNHKPLYLIDLANEEIIIPVNSQAESKSRPTPGN